MGSENCDNSGNFVVVFPAAAALLEEDDNDDGDSSSSWVVAGNTGPDKGNTGKIISEADEADDIDKRAAAGPS